ncbi:MAG: DUF2795 domain-containing protein [Patescibacteria group bacterium]
MTAKKTPSAAELQKYLKGVSYPASKQELVSAAQSNEAPQEVMDHINMLPEKDYGGPQEVEMAFGEMSEE